MTDLNRRRLLTLSAATAAGSLLPPSLHQAMAEPVRRGGLRAVEHVVILMQENRSFDNYFGTLRGDGTTLPGTVGGGQGSSSSLPSRQSPAVLCPQ